MAAASGSPGRWATARRTRFSATTSPSRRTCATSPPPAARRLPSLDRAEELVAQLGYAQHRREAVGTLSGGTRQKLNLTLALMHDPGVLLLDEPYQGFDWETYLRFWGLVTDLRARRKAIVIITHLVFEQDRFDLLADLSGGRLTPRALSGKDSHASR